MTHIRSILILLVRRPAKAEGVRGQSQMAAIRHEARGVAREPDGGTPGRYAASHCLLSMIQ
ncbi:hypothetical protein [Alcaligenes sp. SMD-FA]|uniref:hypothetical protein n=1 Tax=Alcaligenes sp. SMD-FA TaxID=2991054 RepID=UPI0022278515|nr:hypothetical protein [Alcaligenes sp. SMD-FA]UYY86346.1 hypothetical protein OKX01_13670 [Alcaligenes sp. SMD-FA]